MILNTSDVAVNILKLIFVMVFSDRAFGMNKLVTKPINEIAKITTETNASPFCCEIKATPNMVPSNMAKKVPISIKPLAAMISFSCKCCGKILYFKGPKKAD